MRNMLFCLPHRAVRPLNLKLPNPLRLGCGCGGKHVESIDHLLSAFFANYPYYHRPCTSEGLYSHSRSVYLNNYGGYNQVLTTNFFNVMELTGAEREIRLVSIPWCVAFVIERETLWFYRM